MVNVKVESFIQISTFLRTPSWYKIPGDAFSLWNLHQTALIFWTFLDGNCILQVVHFLASRVNLMLKNKTQIPKFADEPFQMTNPVQTWSFGKRIFGSYLHPCIAMAGDRWCGKLCNVSTSSCSHKKCPRCPDVIKDVVFSMYFILSTGIHSAILSFVSLPFH